MKLQSTQTVSLVLVLVCFRPAGAQCFDWVQWSQPPLSDLSPLTGEIGSMTYDAGRGMAMGFGSHGSTAVSWLWNGKGWAACEFAQQLGPPANRRFYGTVYDSAHDYVLMVGGDGGSPNETWSWDGTTWTYRGHSPASAPNPVNALAYDAARQEIILFGGSSVAGYSDQTWVWDGTSWVQRLPATRPSARTSHAMAYDSARQVVVLFGGCGDAGCFDDTWEWDGTSWTQQTPSLHPPALRQHAIAYDSARGVTVLFGGIGPTGQSSSNTWDWDGQTWALQSPSTSPGARYGHSMAFDSRRGKIVVFGGYCESCGCCSWGATQLWEFPAMGKARILSQPGGQSVCLEGSVTFKVSAIGDPPLYYEWKRDGTGLNLPGAQSPMLTVTTADFGSMGNYTCVVTNPCGSVESTPAALSVCAGVGGCPQPLDVNGDGVVDGLDIQRFVEVLLGW